ncbi:hypothetical protein C8P63_10542 [Melghirimyces profundicolus]|uniref:Actin-like protein N-terminal domain-containing protein n=1 Tax=Melghirimyces profundicolus TaxID=1242148 RepID=A0A2T6C2I4_9BACL|nr:ParM/StbA family protein [Melghirimyces profundicolus]PTX62447.1 hypothetical protein C8P63_10542 [Melghirimyces profundicolus]
MDIPLIAVDAGRHGTKVKNARGMFCFPSSVSKAIEGHREHLENDLEVRYNGKDYFVGELAQREGYPQRLMTESKVHDQTLLEVLVAVFRSEVMDRCRVMTGLPINLYTDERERAGLKRLLEGEHEVTVNGVHRRFTIEKVGLALECASSYFAAPESGTVRIVDPGARTTNYATFKDGIYIGKESGTIPLGWDSVRGADPDLMAGQIASEIGKSWSPSNRVKIIGGKAEELEEPLKRIGFGFAYAAERPLYANVEGFYEVGRSLTHA